MTVRVDGDAGFYQDLNSIQQIKGNSDKQAALEAAAGQFEAIFLQNVLKNMRSANEALQDPDDKLFKDQPIYRDMYDGQLAMNLVQRGGMGIKRQLVQQLSPTLQNSAPVVASDVQSNMVAFNQPLNTKK
jgi:flagellar protein FlgJ